MRTTGKIGRSIKPKNLVEWILALELLALAGLVGLFVWFHYHQ